MKDDSPAEAARFLIDAYANRHHQAGAEPYALTVARAYIEAMERADVSLPEGAILYGPNTVSVQGDNGPFGPDAGRVHIWFRTYREAMDWVAALSDPAGKK